MQRRALRTMGLRLVVLGAILIALGLYLLNTTMVNCPANGCWSAVLWSIYGPYEVVLWSGVALVVAGVAMLIWSFMMPQEAGKSVMQPQTRLFRRLKLGD